MNHINIFENMIYLISCILNHKIPSQDKITNISNLYKISQYHSLTSMIAMALESSGIFSTVDPSIAKQWKTAKEKTIRKNILLDTERTKILNEMEKDKIWYMPLKGTVLENLYPKYGMREMADNDILYDASRQNDVKKIFLNHHYHIESIGKGVHDVYMKEPIYNFEMHTALIADEFNKDWAKYYRTIKEKLLITKGTQYGYHFSNEDFYIYMIVHAFKHYSNSGTGLRTLVDIYVFNQNKYDALNKDYLKQELNYLGIAGFEKETRQLSNKLFDFENAFCFQILNENEKQLFLYYCGSGTYGNTKNRVENNLKQFQREDEPIDFMTKLKYCFSRLFPNREWCKNNAPFFYKYFYLLPFYWIYRIIFRMILRNQNIKQEVKTLIKISKRSIY